MDLQELAALRRSLASDGSPDAQRRLVEVMELETSATREAVARVVNAPPYLLQSTLVYARVYVSFSLTYIDRRRYGSKPGSSATPAEETAEGASQSPRRSYRESPRRTPSPGSPDVQASPAQSDSSFQRRVKFGADRTLSFHQTAAERLAQRCDEIVAVISGSFDDGHASLAQMQRVLRDMDPSRTGVIPAGDFGWAIEDMELGLTVQEIDELVEALDARNEEACQYNELLAALGASPAAPRTDVHTEASKPKSPDSAGSSPAPQLAKANDGGTSHFDAGRGPEESEAPEPEPQKRGSAGVSRAAAPGVGFETLGSVFATTDMDPHEPSSVQALAAFNDRLEAEVLGGTRQHSTGKHQTPRHKLTSKEGSAAADSFKPKLSGRAAEVAARAKPKGDIADLWECTFEPDTHPQVLNRHGLTGVRPPAETARTRLLQEYIARELQIADTDYMSDRLLDEVVAEAAANGWLTQSNVKQVVGKHGTEKLRTIANILKERNAMALVDAQLKQVQEERDRQRIADAAATERTNAQAQKAWMTDLRASTPNRARRPWKPTRGVGTADGSNSPRKVGNMAHDESVVMKKQHDLKYGSYSTKGVPASSPRRVRPAATPDGKKPMTFEERMQADILNRQRKMNTDLEQRGSARKPRSFVLARGLPAAASPRAGKQRRPSKMSPPRPARISRGHLSPERAKQESSWLSKADMSHEEEDALMEERALAAIEARLQRLAGEFNSRHSHRNRKKSGGGGSPTKVRPSLVVDVLPEPQLVPPQPMLEPEPEPEPEPKPEPQLELQPQQESEATEAWQGVVAHGTSLDRYPTMPAARPVEDNETAMNSADQEDEQVHQDATSGSLGGSRVSTDSSGGDSPLLLPHEAIYTKTTDNSQSVGGDGGDAVPAGNWLRQLGLSSIKSQLEELGVEEEEDLKHLQESDVEALNLKVVTARKLRSAISRYQ